MFDFNTPKFIKLVFAAFFLFVMSCQQKDPDIKSDQNELEEVIEEEITESTVFYGITVDSLQIIEGKIKWSQTLSKILEKYNVSNDKLLELSKVSKSTYDVRKLKAGTNYTILARSLNDDELQATHFIFEPEKTFYVIYHLGDSVYADLVQRPVNTVERAIACTITTSVYEAALDAGASPLLVSMLVDILAWQVDFFRIQKGDRFKVIYEEEVTGNQVVGIRQIKGVYFEHFGKPYYGIYYKTNGKSDYFDETGNSLRKAFLRSPLNYKRISSRYSPKRFHPVLKTYKAHLGTDYAADPGTPIRTIGDGIIEEATFNKNNGNYVKIRHNSNYSTQYLHMQSIKTGIKPRAKVRQGETIGYVGSTGLANGPHLCFRFWKNGIQVDALKVDLPPTEPIKASELSGFLHQKNILVYQLERISFEKSDNSHHKLVAMP